MGIWLGPPALRPSAGPLDPWCAPAADRALEPCCLPGLRPPRAGFVGAGPVAPAADSLAHGALPGIDDAEGPRLPRSLPPVIDAHVHLFPDGVFDALWRWFRAYAWPVRYPLYARQVIDFQLSRGVEHLVALHYAHKPGMAAALNTSMAALVADEPRVTGVATVLPGEPDAVEVLAAGFDAGLRGAKLHCHVQCFAPDSPEVGPLAALCAQRGQPLVMHAGREPRSPAYACDPHQICAAERVDALLTEHPGLTLVVPHLGADEFEPYVALLEKHDGLWLDTTMMAAGFFAVPGLKRLLSARPDRLMYGSDFPNLPYAWDREVRAIAELRLREADLEAILGGNARRLWRPEIRAVQVSET